MKSTQGGCYFKKRSAPAFLKLKTMVSWIGISTPEPMRPSFLRRCLSQCSMKNSTEPKTLKRILSRVLLSNRYRNLWGYADAECSRGYLERDIFLSEKYSVLPYSSLFVQFPTAANTPKSTRILSHKSNVANKNDGCETSIMGVESIR